MDELDRAARMQSDERSTQFLCINPQSAILEVDGDVVKANGKGALDFVPSQRPLGAHYPGK
jgi:hypothetical protein